jgi:hypothetical protein
MITVHDPMMQNMIYDLRYHDLVYDLPSMIVYALLSMS